MKPDIPIDCLKNRGAIDPVSGFMMRMSLEKDEGYKQTNIFLRGTTCNWLAMKNGGLMGICNGMFNVLKRSYWYLMGYIINSLTDMGFV